MNLKLFFTTLLHSHRWYVRYQNPYSQHPIGTGWKECATCGRLELEYPEDYMEPETRAWRPPGAKRNNRTTHRGPL